MRDGPGVAKGPPRAASWLLRRVLGEQRYGSLIGDLDEMFRRESERRGRRAAVVRYWVEALHATVVFALGSRRHAVASRRRDWPGSFLADVRYSGRVLWKDGGFALTCVVTLGVSIGATAAIFGIVNPVLLQPVPYMEPDRLVMVWEREVSGNSSTTSYATSTDIKREARTLERAAAVGSWEAALSGGGNAERVTGQRVSWEYFQVLGVRPWLGRDFTEAEDIAGSGVVILSHGVWSRWFGGDARIAGKTIEINGRDHLVAGVMPADFDNVLSPRAQIWRVLGYNAQLPYACRTCRHLQMIARTDARASMESVNAELDRISESLVQTYPTEYPAAGMNVVPLAHEITAESKPVLIAVMGASVLLLLIAMVNVANLQLARALRRRPEFAVRRALGAGQSRLMRQLFAEAALIAVLGAAAGLLAAWLALPVLRQWLPESLPRLSAIRLDGATLGFVGISATLLTLVVAVLPAIGARLPDTSIARMGSTRTTTRRHPAQAVLVVSEIALALTLLTAAGLLSRSLLRLFDVDAGFDAANLLTLEVQAIGEAYGEDETVWTHFENVIQRVEAVPGVVAAGVSNQIPMDGNFDRYGIHAQDKPLANPELAPSADRYSVTPGALEALGIRLVKGRAFVDADNRASAVPVVMVSRALASNLWPGEDAVGKHVQLGGPDGPWREVVGIAEDVRHHGLDNPLLSQIFIPARQWMFADNVAKLVVRTTSDPMTLVPSIRDAIRSLDPSQPVMRIATMKQLMLASSARRQVALLVFVAFAILAAGLASAGIYGILAAAVVERTREIGVRTALGATPGNVLGLMARDAGTLTLAGLMLGVLGTSLLSGFLESLLFQVRPADPLTLLAESGLMSVIACAASLAPVRRALRVNPRTALEVR